MRFKVRMLLVLLLLCKLAEVVEHLGVDILPLFLNRRSSRGDPAHCSDPATRWYDIRRGARAGHRTDLVRVQRLTVVARAKLVRCMLLDWGDLGNFLRWIRGVLTPI